MRWLGWCVLVICVALRGGDAAAQFERDAAFVSGEPVEHSIELPSGETMRFKVVMPPAIPGARALQYSVLAESGDMSLLHDTLDPDGASNRSRSVLLALPPGPQTMAMVDTSLALYWQQAALMHGWIVVSPEAPSRIPFHERDGSELDALHEWIMQNLPMRGKVHLAGVSNGGKSAFHEALRKPGRYASLTGLPGVPSGPGDVERLERLKEVPVLLLVGELDSAWLEQSRQTRDVLRDAGAHAILGEYPGSGHQLPEIVGNYALGALSYGLERMPMMEEWDAPQPQGLAGLAQGAASGVNDGHDAVAVRSVLDAFHRAAAEADGATYFGSFHESAVFLGTDGTERWDLASFRAFAEPYFNRASAWTYTPRVRYVDFSPDGAVAWFDEVLWNEKLGECRGSGVLLKTERGWKVAQYNLTMLVPNRSAAGVAALIRASADEEPTDDE